MKLLLVEDNPLLVAELEKQLKQAGYITDVTDKAIEADYLMKETDYDCVILDIGLPDGNGLSLVTKWRERGINTPVIMLTARSQWHEKVEGFNAGADDYLGKPFHAQELLARIQALIHRAHGRVNSSSKQLCYAGVNLDENEQKVTVGEHIYELTSMEFRLLKIFLMSPKKLLSKQQLTDKLYQFDDEKESNVVEVYVTHLRKKLGKTAIETRRGQGYIFHGIIE
ncbi:MULTISPECIES: response regulator transcription factor [Shewanella]|jgi:two-component system OmpR family response regulator|uniref:Two component transcriptional regulator, winged helix family n=4 Tax=Shewanella TaxID=22 RepID=Q07XY4_SHEFN|nr:MULTISPECIES: response regulator transcription factor [Shewanella]MBB1381710.1 response regulator transcription factor [Shewanella sp. SR41-2]ABI73130.1 two component transcriptional regulator, winged helix family [Shewanella frigidimarina NCIMB 400]KVX02909.1 two-component system response regulator [Shewanella frigidimarina]MBB1428336.1 response regulator transcription factor [Shewanella sp. SG44-2]RPA33763.1 DNA-binding response regulator [Shewanella frigidimarina]|tara:strand:- start:856 stop:1530 length:675 start_codon:yes stop_codon:yes gene_type:complete